MALVQNNKYEFHKPMRFYDLTNIWAYFEENSDFRINLKSLIAEAED